MRNKYLSLVCIGMMLFSCSRNASVTQKQKQIVSQDSVKETINQEMPAQEVPMRLLDKLGELYGDNPPGVTGFSVESKNCPDYIGGIYINDQDTLVIQIRGDSAIVRKKLEEALQSKEFIVEPVKVYTQKELMVIRNQLIERRESLKDVPALRNVKGWSIHINNIEIDLIMNTPEKRKEFREQVMDSPAFLFVGTETPIEDATVGVNDVKGVALRPEYTVYSTDTEQVKFILYNQSGVEVGCGAEHYITYEDEEGVWRRLPINGLVIDILYMVRNGDRTEFIASLYPDVHPNRPGRYRFFYDVTVGEVPGGEDITMMTEFRLSDNIQELAQAAKTPLPKIVLGGLTVEEYLKKEEHFFATHVFDFADVMPEYPDGDYEGLQKFIKENTPKDIAKEGYVTISFVVERDGSLTNIEVDSSSEDKQLEDEAIRIVKKMPKWIPGRKRDKVVRVKSLVTIGF